MGVISVKEGTSISPIHISSPICLTFIKGRAAEYIFAVPSSEKITSSTIITASLSSGRGSPVSTGVNISGARVTGVLSDASFVSSLFTAIPSIDDAL